MKYYLVGGILSIIITTVVLTSDPKHTIKTELQPDHDRYYCHETGFLMHHWELQKGNWIDTMERNKWEEPVKCEAQE